jgi:pimeloyl-ACP methyl ester carboxylesterase
VTAWRLTSACSRQAEVGQGSARASPSQRPNNGSVNWCRHQHEGLQLMRGPLDGASSYLARTPRAGQLPTMARTVLVIHGAGEPRRRGGKVYWEPLLEKSLGGDYIVQAPRMPRPNEPRYRTWARRIAELVAGIQNPALVGHSFGASVLLKYLSEAAPRPSLAGLFLIATP